MVNADNEQSNKLRQSNRMLETARDTGTARLGLELEQSEGWVGSKAENRTLA